MTAGAAGKLHVLLLLHGKIMSNGDYLDAHTGQVLGNLFEYVD